MTTYSLPSGAAPSRRQLARIYNDERYLGETGAVQVRGKTGNRWGLLLEWENATGDRYRLASNLIDKLSGIHRLTVDLSTLGYTRSGTGGGSPQTNGSHSAGARQIAFDNASGGSVTDYLKEGDFVQIGNELKRVREDVDTTTNAGTIEIWPELHQDYGDAVALDITSPAGVFMLVSSDGDLVDPSGITPIITLNLEEDVLA